MEASAGGEWEVEKQGVSRERMRSNSGWVRKRDWIFGIKSCTMIREHSLPEHRTSAKIFDDSKFGKHIIC